MASAESVVRPHPLIPESTDRRVHTRALLESPILVDALNSWQKARTENVSAGGVALSCEGPLPIGKTVEIYFELPSGVAIETRAQVVRSRGAFAALRFLTLDRPSEIALRVHCRNAPPAPD